MKTNSTFHFDRSIPGRWIIQWWCGQQTVHAFKFMKLTQERGRLEARWLHLHSPGICLAPPSPPHRDNVGQW